MSSMVSRRPASMNHRKDAFWMSIRFGRSRTCFRREKLLRGRGATTPLLNDEASLEKRRGNVDAAGGRSTAGTGQLSETEQACARAGQPWAQSGECSTEAEGRVLEFSSQSGTIRGPLVPRVEGKDR